jgi:hypothetical protein
MREDVRKMALYALLFPSAIRQRDLPLSGRAISHQNHPCFPFSNQNMENGRLVTACDVPLNLVPSAKSNERRIFPRRFKDDAQVAQQRLHRTYAARGDEAAAASLTNEDVDVAVTQALEVRSYLAP